MNNKTLIAAVGVALALSVFSYMGTQARADRFERGQKFLSRLNSDNIQEIHITKGGEKTVLRRGEDQFLITTSHNYPAKNEAVNRFIKDTLGIELEKEVGTGADLEKELEIAESDKSIDVVLRNDAGKDMVHFVIGKASDDGRGNYIQRKDGEDQAVYLTSKGVYLSTEGDQFLDKDLLDVAEDKIREISGPDYTLARDDAGLKLKDLPAGKEESSEVAGLKRLLAGLTFDKALLADDAAVSGLNFGRPIRVALTDDSGYLLYHTVDGDTHYLKVEATFDMSKLEGITIGADDSEEQLKANSALLTRRDEVNAFNDFHGSWVYALSSYNGKKLQLKRADLIKAPPKDEN